MLIAVNYHYVRPVFEAPYPGIHGITPEQLATQLQLFGRAGEFVDQATVLAALSGEDSMPDRAFVLTFDDGLAEQYIHALPVLNNMGVPAIFFPNTAPLVDSDVSTVHKIHLIRAHTEPRQFSELLREALHERQIEIPAEDLRSRAVEHYKYDAPQVAEVKLLLNFVLDPNDRDAVIEDLFAAYFARGRVEVVENLYMHRDQLRTLAQAGYLGSHAHEHIPLGLLTPEEAAFQLSYSAELLTEWTGYPPRAISYPYGSRVSFAAHTRDAAAQAGFAFGFTMERAANGNLRNPLLLSRFDNNDMPGGKAALWSIETLFDAVNTSQWWNDA